MSFEAGAQTYDGWLAGSTEQARIEVERMRAGNANAGKIGMLGVEEQVVLLRNDDGGNHQRKRTAALHPRCPKISGIGRFVHPPISRQGFCLDSLDCDFL